MNRGTLMIIRGPSGAGKSTLSRSLLELNNFMDEDLIKEFTFDLWVKVDPPRKNFYWKEWHEQMMGALDEAMDECIPLCILHNVHENQWSYQDALDLAVHHNYRVHILTLEPHDA